MSADAAAGYRGRFAPSPTGPLHAGSLVAALASWLDARAHGGKWLIRIEDVDTARCVPGADQTILSQLSACGLTPDEPPLWQSRRSGIYQHALSNLIDSGQAYPCGCTRQDIALALSHQGEPLVRHAAPVYPGTCRDGLQGSPARAWRLNTVKIQSNQPLAQSPRRCVAIKDIAKSSLPETARDSSLTPHAWHWSDRWLGPQQQDVALEVGDFVIRRADGLWAYQLAVVVDDAAQGISHVVRGADLADNTARQMVLQHALALPCPVYMHTPLVVADDGEKLSKQHGAPPVDVSTPARALHALQAASQVLGLNLPPHTPFNDVSVHLWLDQAINAWRLRLQTL